MAASDFSAADTHLCAVVDDGWKITDSYWQNSISDSFSRSHLISQSGQRSPNFNQVPPAFPGIRINDLERSPLPPVAQGFAHSLHQDFVDIRPIPSFHPGPPPQLTSYPVLEYGNYHMAQHPNSYLEYPVGFDIYGNVSGPSLYVGHLVGNLASNHRYLLQPILHSGPGPEVHQHPGFPYDFNPQYHYPTHPNTLISLQIPQHTSVSPLIPGSSSTHYLGNFNQQSSFFPGLPANAPTNIVDRSPGSFHSHLSWGSHNKPRAPYISPRPGARHHSRLEPALTLPRSFLLDDFCSNRDSIWNLKDIFGHIVEFSGDQHGSRFIQQKLEEATDEEKQCVFDEIVPMKTTQLIQDVFGNYVIQSLLRFGTQAQKDLLLVVIEQNVVPFSLQIYGCRVVQKAIEYASPEQQTKIILGLQPHILKCIKDAHGNYVIQKLIQFTSPERLMFLSTICDNLFGISIDLYGCRVLQRCLDYLPEEHTISLLQAVHHFTIDLMQDQYGNYVIQSIIQQGRPPDKSRVISKIRGNLIQLAQHKFASIVCEKALIYADIETRRLLIDEIMTLRSDGQSAILTMVKDRYANYVLQRALTVVDSDQRESFFQQVKPVLAAMKKSTSAYNRPLISIERLIDMISCT